MRKPERIFVGTKHSRNRVILAFGDAWNNHGVRRENPRRADELFSAEWDDKRALLQP